jgi:transcription elongation factor Elf1
MANCAHCNKVFTCGCQKASLGNGVIVCKQCKAKAEANVSTSRDLNLELARQQIQDLKNR